MFFSGAERGRNVVCPMLEAEDLQQLIGTLAVGAGGGQRCSENVIADIEVGNEMELLEYKPDVFSAKPCPSILSQGIEIGTIDLDRATGGLEQAAGGHEEG